MYNEYSDTFHYTKSNQDTGSSFVEEIFYDENDQSLAVSLDNGGYYSQLYVYSGVPKQVAENFMNATSKGQFYTPYIKGKYSSLHLGDTEDYDFERTDVEQAAGYTSLRTVPPVQREDSFTPKALYEKGDSRTPLRVVEGEKPQWTVNFHVGNDGRIRTHIVEAATLQDAVAAVGEISEVIKSVTDLDVTLVGVNLSE